MTKLLQMTQSLGLNVILNLEFGISIHIMVYFGYVFSNTFTRSKTEPNETRTKND